MDSLIKTILDGNFAALKEYCEEGAASRLTSRINDMKVKIVARMNGKSVDEMLTIMAPAVSAEIVTEAAKKKEDPKAKVRNKPECIFDNTSPKVTDNKDHFPINTEARARNALARANGFKKVPTWYKGSLESLLKAVTRAVKKKYKNIEVDVKKDTTPGKD